MKKPRVTYLTEIIKNKKSLEILSDFINKNAKKWHKQNPEINAISIERKVKKGKQLKSFAITFHVEEKKLNPEKKIKEFFKVEFPNGKFKNIRTDIKESYSYEPRQENGLVEISEIAIQRNTGEWGTIGCFLRAANGGDLYFCTNMHVLQPNQSVTNFFRPKNQQIQPDVFLIEGIGSSFKVNAFLERGTLNHTDLAIVRIQKSNEHLIANAIADEGIPSGIIENINSVDWRHMDIFIKGGKTITKQQGMITAIGLNLPNDNLQNLLVANLFSQHGDSGSPIFDEFLQLIGILVGGPEGTNDISYIVPISEILSFVKNDNQIKDLNLQILTKTL